MEGLHLLVIDDEPAVTVVLSHAAARWGSEVTPVRTIADARAAAESDIHYDVLVIDITLPDGSGLDFLAELRQTERYRTRPAIILTGGAGSGLVGEGESLDARVITKPFSPTKLGALISEIISNSGDAE